jgi:hypothetical protein
MATDRNTASFHRFFAAIVTTVVLAIIVTTQLAAPANGIEWL